MNTTDNQHYQADKGCFLVRKSDQVIMGEAIDLGSGDPRNLIYQIREAANMLGDVCYAEGHLENNVYVKKVDYVFISMGYNDANNGYIAGTLDSVKSVAWTDFTPGSNYSNFPSIAATVKYCLFYLKNTVIRGTVTVNGGTYDVALDCRTAKIMWQTPVATTSLFGSHDAEWTDSRLLAVESVISDVCEHYSVPVVNGRKLCGFTREEEALTLMASISRTAPILMMPAI